MQANIRFRSCVTIASVLALVCAAGCHKKTATADTADAAVAPAPSDSFATAAIAPEDEGDGGEIAPPDAVVAQDPNIPVNEAVVGAAPLPPDYTADIAPPVKAVIEEEPARPEADDVWIPGYWWWSPPLHRYVWVGGAWRHPPPDQVWSPGRWHAVGARYVWAPGYWGPRGYARVEIEAAPPPVRIEVRPPSPGVEFVWTPGYYGWEGGRYEWRGGSWVRPPHPGVTWIEPRYVRTGTRYYLQPGRWDYAAGHRGIALRPDINVLAGARVRLAPVAPTVLVAHERFVADSAHAVARGAVRTERGGFIVPRANVAIDARHPVVEEHGRVDVHGRVEEPRGREIVDTHVGGGRVVVPPPGHAVVERRVETRVNVPAPGRGRVEVRTQPTPQQQQQHRGREPERGRHR
jgi:hypothetical protein